MVAVVLEALIKGGQCSQQFSLGSCAGECKQLLWTLSCRAWFSRIGEHSSLHWLWATGKERQRSSQCNFLFQSLPICKEMFLHLYAMSYSRFLWLKKHYENHECMEMARDCLKTPLHMPWLKMLLTYWCASTWKDSWFQEQQHQTSFFQWN